MKNIQVQTPQTKLDQVELMNQFIGTWKGEFEENSIFICENKQFSNGIISNSQITTNGKIIESLAQPGLHRKLQARLVLPTQMMLHSDLNLNSKRHI